MIMMMDYCHTVEEDDEMIIIMREDGGSGWQLVARYWFELFVLVLDRFVCSCR